MNKDEILERAQKQRGIDEREQRVYGDAFGFGSVVMALLCVVLSVVSALKGRSFYEFGVILFGYLSAVQFHQYSKLKIRTYFMGALACLIAALGGMAAYLFLGYGYA